MPDRTDQLVALLAELLKEQRETNRILSDLSHFTEEGWKALAERYYTVDGESVLLVAIKDSRE